MRILVAGGGIAGMGAALALSGRGHEIVVLDRDAPPPTGSMNEIFEHWERPGATQLRHSHVFLARIYNLLRGRYPDLLAELMQAGARELRFRDGLSPRLRERYQPRESDTEISILSCRRTTLEAVMRTYVERLFGVELLRETKVRGIEIEHSDHGPRARALEIERVGRSERLAGDIIIDASGRNSQFIDWLTAHGIFVPTEEAPSGILYYTRHYRLRPGRGEPERSRTPYVPSAGDLGYIRYCIFPADQGNFSITVALPESETELRARILDPLFFDALCTRLPAVAPWTDLGRSAPVGKVFAMGNLKSAWRDWVVGGKPLLLDLFAIGDATMRTNPLYGRGCTAGILHAHILADVLRATDDPVARAKFFAARTKEELRPFYDSMVRADAGWIARAAKANDPKRRLKRRERLMRSFAEDALLPSTRGSLKVARRLARPFHMLEAPNDWLKNPGIIAHLMVTWATPRALKSRLYTGRLGPARGELLALARKRG